MPPPKKTLTSARPAASPDSSARSSSSARRNCASGSDKFYDVQNASDLSAAFKAIAAQISELRISR